MNCQSIKDYIITWLCRQREDSGLEGFVVGVSGGVDSALVSTLCALTGIPTICVSMPINQSILPRAQKHLDWLCIYSNVSVKNIDLTITFNSFKSGLNFSELAFANTCARLRMTTLYGIANTKNYLVVGTGNKVEDYGVMFFTKWGDGAYDINPIADLLKTEVYELSSYLGIHQDILDTKPTDGLWNDGRSDEDQLGATYPELEWAMKEHESGRCSSKGLEGRQKEIWEIYLKWHNKGLHKIVPVPICHLYLLKNFST